MTRNRSVQEWINWVIVWSEKETMFRVCVFGSVCCLHVHTPSQLTLRTKYSLFRGKGACDGICFLWFFLLNCCIGHVFRQSRRGVVIVVQWGRRGWPATEWWPVWQGGVCGSGGHGGQKEDVMVPCPGESMSTSVVRKQVYSLSTSWI